MKIKDQNSQFKIENSIFSFLFSKFSVVFLFSIFCFLFSVSAVQAATLSASPSTGTFTVGSTFDVSIFLNTEGQIINAVEVSLAFPSDKLQVISPSTGQSIITIWTSPPSFNNQTGRMNLQGGIPGGINVSNGLVSRITFRVKSVGSAILQFLDDSKVLLHDGKGTEVLGQKTNGVFELVLPPPAGPIVASETHPDQTLWYSNPNVLLKWASESEIDGYSYVLNEEPIDLPDNISEGLKNSVTYTNVADGIHYFHIKALKGGGWGGVTHFVVKIDTTPPAEFPIEVVPGARTVRRQPVVSFASTDALSGISHYELKIVSLKPPKNPADQPLFIEVTSPYVFSTLDLGKYDIILRAYDKAGNYREAVQRLTIVGQIFQIISGKGLEIKNVIFIPWVWFWIISGLFLFLLAFLAWKIREWHNLLSIKREKRQLPEHIKKQLEELRRYRERYGGKIFLLFCVGIVGAMLFLGQQIFAQQIELNPPLITTVSRNISNEEIFYVGGKTDTPQTQVIIYLQNLQTGATRSETVTSDNRGDWFYRHNTFLSSGKYLLWAQSKIAEQVSPPSPQIEMNVQPTAIQFGASRISYEILYEGIIVFLFLILALLIGYIIFHGYHGRKKHFQFIKEMREAEEAIRRGFAVLRRDIEAELAIVSKAKLKKKLSAEEKIREEQLLRDLAAIEQQIGKEVWDVWEVER